MCKTIKFSSDPASAPPHPYLIYRGPKKALID